MIKKRDRKREMKKGMEKDRREKVVRCVEERQWVSEWVRERESERQD